jgi:RND family efflux transporter MFP subunit
MLGLVLVVLVAVGLGWWGRGLVAPAPSMDGAPAEAAATGNGPCPGGAQALYWKAPMDPTYIRDDPGKSPMGMDLVPECPSAGGEAPAGSVRIDSSTIQNIGVRTAPVEVRDLRRTIRTVGRISYDERLIAHVHTKIQGWVEKLLVDYVGQEVKRGQPLLEIYSPELVATQEELLLAASYQRATGESPFEDVNRAGSALFEATKRRLELWDIAEHDIDRLLETREIKKTLTLHAPTRGVVTELRVRSGMEVKPNDNLYTIADLSTVWLLADVYESELPWVELGQQGSVHLSYLPNMRFSGTVTYISPFLDPKTRTVQVRLELPNPDGHLRPEMFGETVIQGKLHRARVAVPSEAVMRSGQRTLIVVALGEGRFEPREVELGLDSGDGWFEVSQGVDPGEQVVVSSQFLIDSESRLKEAVQKLLGAKHEMPDAADEQHEHMQHGEH